MRARIVLVSAAIALAVLLVAVAVVVRTPGATVSAQAPGCPVSQCPPIDPTAPPPCICPPTQPPGRPPLPEPGTVTPPPGDGGDKCTRGRCPPGSGQGGTPPAGWRTPGTDPTPPPATPVVTPPPPTPPPATPVPATPRPTESVPAPPAATPAAQATPERPPATIPDQPLTGPHDPTDGQPGAVRPAAIATAAPTPFVQVSPLQPSPAATQVPSSATPAPASTAATATPAATPRPAAPPAAPPVGNAPPPVTVAQAVQNDGARFESGRYVAGSRQLAVGRTTRVALVYSVSNSGSERLDFFNTVIFALGDGVAPVSATPTRGTATIAPRQVSWGGFVLDPGERASITLELDVTPSPGSTGKTIVLIDGTHTTARAASGGFVDVRGGQLTSASVGGLASGGFVLAALPVVAGALVSELPRAGAVAAGWSAPAPVPVLVFAGAVLLVAVALRRGREEPGR